MEGQLNIPAGKQRDNYQSAISDELREMPIFSLVDLLFEDAQSHGLLDDLVVIWDVSFIHATLEQFGRIMSTSRYERRPG